MSSRAAAGEIRVDGLTRRFGKTVAVHPFSLTIGPGGVTGLLGPNGSGKSTFLRLLLGLVPPDAGTASLDGELLRGDGLAIRRRVPYSPGEIALHGETKGREQLKWLVEGRGTAARARAFELADAFDLPMEKKVHAYSHGMKRLLLLAAALAPEARIRLLDEPTEGLDPTRRGQVLALLAAESKRGVTILLSSHHFAEVERVCDRMLFLKSGELLDEAAARALYASAKRTVRVTFHGDPDEERLNHALQAAGASAIRLGPRAATFTLPEGDSRAALAKLLAEIEEPETLVFGALSLQELYRELYGTEGI